MRERSLIAFVPMIIVYDRTDLVRCSVLVEIRVRFMKSDLWFGKFGVRNSLFVPTLSIPGSVFHYMVAMTKDTAVVKRIGGPL